MEWTNEYDVLQGKEILLVNPFKTMRKTSLRGQLLTEIVDTLNGLKEQKLSVSQRSARDRIKILANKLKKNCC